MSLGVVLSTVIWIFAAVVVTGSVGFLVIDAMDKVESIKKRVPWIPKILERRDAFVVLLLMCFVLLVGVGYEFLTKEMPDMPNVVMRIPTADPEGKDAQIAQVKMEVQNLKTQQPKTIGPARIETVSELCRVISSPKCPITEIQRRALVLANEIDALADSFYRAGEQARIQSQGPVLDKTKQEELYATLVRAASARTMSDYRSKYQGEALAYRHELIARIGEPGMNDSMKETIYGIANVAILRDIATDLRSLANNGKFPAPSSLK